MVERWAARMEGTDGAEVYLRYKQDGKLFRRYTRNALETRLTECQFADDAGLLASSRKPFAHLCKLQVTLGSQSAPQKPS